MNDELIERYIAMPLAISVFKNDREEFKEFKTSNVYLDMVDSAIEQLEKEFYALRQDLNKQQINIKKIGSLEYSVNGEVVTYTSDQLKEMTRRVMEQCLSSVEIKEINSGWFDQEGI